MENSKGPRLLLPTCSRVTPYFWMQTVLSPRWGWHANTLKPTAYAVGCTLLPLRGWNVRGWRLDYNAKNFIALPLKLHRHRLAIGCRHFKELPLLEAKHSRQNIRGKRLDLGVQIADYRIVVTARVLNRVLGLAERALQLGKLLGSFELGIIFRNRKQALESATELVLSFGLVAGSRSLHGLRA